MRLSDAGSERAAFGPPFFVGRRQDGRVASADLSN